jgi:hypothetical protein
MKARLKVARKDFTCSAISLNEAKAIQERNENAYKILMLLQFILAKKLKYWLPRMCAKYRYSQMIPQRGRGPWHN